MMRLKSKLLSLNANKTNKVKVYSPRNCEELRIPFKTDKTAKVVGKLASIPQPVKVPKVDGGPQEPQLITGVLVQNDFKMSLMAPEDLREYAGLTTTTITCRQRLKLSAAGIDLIKWGLEGTFGSIEELPEAKPRPEQATNGDGDTKMEGDADEEFPIDEVVAAYLVMGCVTVRYRTSGEVELEWEGNMLNDGIADAVMAVLLGIESSPAAVKRKHPHPFDRPPNQQAPSTPANPLPTGSASKHAHAHSHPENNILTLPHRNLHANLSPEERLERLMMFLEAQFGADNVSPIAEPKLPPTPPPSSKPEEERNHNGTGVSKDEDDAATTTKKEEDKDKDEEGEGKGVKGEEEDGDAEERRLRERQQAELARLHRLGIPVPGVSIKVDKMQANVWLERLEVESTNKVFADRVRAVVERAVEVTAPLWG